MVHQYIEVVRRVIQELDHDYFQVPQNEVIKGIIDKFCSQVEEIFKLQNKNQQDLKVQLELQLNLIDVTLEIIMDLLLNNNEKVIILMPIKNFLRQILQTILTKQEELIKRNSEEEKKVPEQSEDEEPLKINIKLIQNSKTSFREEEEDEYEFESTMRKIERQRLAFEKKYNLDEAITPRINNEDFKKRVARQWEKGFVMREVIDENQVAKKVLYYSKENLFDSDEEFNQHLEFLATFQTILITSLDEANRIDLHNDPELLKQYIVMHSKSIKTIDGLEQIWKRYNEKRYLCLSFPQNKLLILRGNDRESEKIEIENQISHYMQSSNISASIVEEIIEFDENSQRVLNQIEIYEYEDNDSQLSKISSNWELNGQSEIGGYSDEKLTYILLQSLEALYVCHIKGVCQGYIEPKNITFNKSLDIKICDFSRAIRIRKEGKYKLKNLTKDYSRPQIVEIFEDSCDHEFTYKELLQNDFYALYKTCQFIKKKVSQLISKTGIIFEIENDFKSLFSREISAASTVMQWKKWISQNNNFIEKLCHQSIIEGNYSSILKILKLSQYRVLFQEIESEIHEKEKESVSFQGSAQDHKLKSKLKKEMNLFEELFENVSLKDIQENTMKRTPQIIKYLQLAVQYRGGFDEEIYIEYFNEVFDFLFRIELETDPFSINVVSSSSVDFLQKLIESDRTIFQSYIAHWISQVNLSLWESELLKLIQVSQKMKWQELELTLINGYCKGEFVKDQDQSLKNKREFAKRAFQITIQLRDQYEVALECSLHTLKLERDLSAVQSMSTKEIKQRIKIFRVQKCYQQLKHFPCYALYHRLIALSPELMDLPNARLKHFKKEKNLIHPSKSILKNQNDFDILVAQQQALSSLLNYQVANFASSKQVEIIAFTLKNLLNQMKENDVLCLQVLQKFVDTELGILQNHSQVTYYLCLDYLMKKFGIKNPPNQVLQQNYYLRKEELLQLDFNSSCRPFILYGVPIFQESFQNLLGLQVSSDISQTELVYYRWAIKESSAIMKGFKAVNPSSITENLIKLNKEGASLFKYFFLSTFDQRVEIPHVGTYYGSIINQMLNGIGYFKYKNGSHYFGSFNEGLMDEEGQFGFNSGSKWNRIQINETVFSDLSHSTSAQKNQELNLNGENNVLWENKSYLVTKIDDEYRSKGPNPKIFIMNQDQKHISVVKVEEKLPNGDIFKGYRKESDNSMLKGELTDKTTDQIYTGWFENNKKEGSGELKFPNGEIYKGPFKNNARTGSAQYVLLSGEEISVEYYKNQQLERNKINNDSEIFIGLTLNGKKQEHGCRNDLKTGNIYFGMFANDLMDGQGKLYYLNKDVYDGLFVKGKRHGPGILNFANGGFYQGAFHEDQYHGKGVLELLDESVTILPNDYLKASQSERIRYNGDFDKGKKSGLGQESSNQFSYQGHFKDGLRDGFGVLKTNGRYPEYYKGNWKNDEKNGLGITESELYIYEGDYKCGKRQGSGKQRNLNDQSEYEGEFKDDEYSGVGILRKLSGEYTYTGNFKEGKYQGDGVIKYKDGSRFRGQFLKSVRHGEGELIYSNQNTYRGAFLNDRISEVSGELLFSTKAKDEYLKVAQDRIERIQVLLKQDQINPLPPTATANQ